MRDPARPPLPVPDDSWDRFAAPRAVTDAHGRFRFLVAGTGSWLLAARPPSSAVASTPVEVVIAQQGATRRADFTLGTGTVHGSYDIANVPREDRRFWAAYLAPIRDAHADPFYAPHQAPSRSEAMAKVEFAGGGGFRFAWLPPDRYVLWIAARDERIVAHRAFDVPVDGQVDLGLIAPGPTVDATFTSDLGDGHGVWVRTIDAGNGEGVFLRTVWVRNGRIELPGIVPGTHRVQAFTVHRWMSDMGFSGDPIGATATVTIGPDGTVDPAKVVFRR